MKSFSSTALVALASSALVQAQTFTACNPLQKKCDPDPAFGNKVECDFHKPCPAFNSQGANINYDDKGAAFTIKADGESPTIHTGNYLFFGEVEVEVQAAPGRGIVTSVVLQSDDLDEVNQILSYHHKIDWEWIGSKNNQVQTNYFSQGNTSTYDRGKTHPVANPAGQYHTYKIRWTHASVVWSIDGQPVRTLTYDEAKGGSAFPQTPMQVKLGTWVGGGAKSSPGTVEWADGKADFTKGPFVGYYRRITITDFAGKDAPATGGVKQYEYTDHSGSYKSIKTVMGHPNEDSKHAENGVGDGHDNGSSSHNENKSAVEENLTATSSSSHPSSTSNSTTSDSDSDSDSGSGSPSSTTMATVGSSSNATATLSSPRKSGPTSSSGSQPTIIPGSGASALPAAGLSLVVAAVAAHLLLL
ncbi:hypothetical protein L249_8625 [Ophiocordyceps polyrhachis-furcata BCC 54312]|uniref:Crh-like protein n=1 Tax=Ophiocordyceps polyrhachis-furcata BCC 54312 TaxID=1330021 RepID=A0A367L6Y5_9HYPO|nr:hypothetical protein L249_8625 [Ophiocordyceps polyrhachis-furcata BCC 54312]